MPPSGFNQKAINGLLEFIYANYKIITKKYTQTNLSEQEFLEASSRALKGQIKDLIIKFPNLEDKGIEGLVTFTTECYRDLAQEIIKGHDKYQRPVIDGKAIQKELKQIKNYLNQFSL